MKKFNEFYNYRTENTHLIEVVGLPSGQVIYLTEEQMKYFTAREIVFFRIYVTLPDNSRVILQKHCFDDKNLGDIKNKISMFTWKY